jgi:hypothetical protein
MDIRIVVQDVYDNGWASSLWFWVILVAVLGLGLVWYFTGWPFGPRGR